MHDCVVTDILLEPGDHSSSSARQPAAVCGPRQTAVPQHCDRALGQIYWPRVRKAAHIPLYCTPILGLSPHQPNRHQTQFWQRKLLWLKFSDAIMMLELS